jgi:hypothetical protein
MSDSGTQLAQTIPLGHMQTWKAMWRSKWGKVGISIGSLGSLKTLFDFVTFLLDLRSRSTEAMTWLRYLSHIPIWAGPIVVVAGVLIVLWDNRRRHRLLLEHKQGTPKVLTERKSERNTETPKLSPYVVPVKYTRLPNLPVLGLETANDGESTAYQVTIPDVKTGTSTISFQADCPRLTKNDEHVYWRVLIQVDTGSVTTGNDLAREMTRQGVEQVEVVINYEDRDHHYATIFELKRNVLAGDTGGISIGAMRQVLLEDRPEDKTPPLPADAPELVLDYHHSERVTWSQEPPSPDKPIIVKNVTPGRNAFNVTILRLVTADGTAEFKPSLITCIEGGNQAEFNARVDGVFPVIKNHLLALLAKSYKEGTPDYDMTRDLFGPKSFTVTIEYEDSSGRNRYAADCEITYTKWHNETHPGRHRIRKIT